MNLEKANSFELLAFFCGMLLGEEPPF